MKKVLSALVLAMVLCPVVSSAAEQPLTLAYSRYDNANNYRDNDNDDNSFYVCYRSRMTMRGSMGNERARYRGCFISERPCASMHKNHFGKYDNQGSADDALDRCMSGKPRFID